MGFEENGPANPGKPGRAVVHLMLSRRILVLVTMAIALPWVVIAGFLVSRNAPRNSRSLPVAYIPARAGASNQVVHSALRDLKPAPFSPRTDTEISGQNSGSDNSAATLVADRSVLGASPSDPPPHVWTAGKKGPWGQIETMLFDIDVPDELLLASQAGQSPVCWHFPGHSREKVLAVLRSAGLPEDEVKTLDESGHWSSADGVTSVEPGDRLVLSLSPAVRAKLYALLVSYPQNARVRSRLVSPWQCQLAVARRRAGAGVGGTAEAAALPAGREDALVCRFRSGLAEVARRWRTTAFRETISRKRAVLARLWVDRDVDPEQLAQYWGIGGRRKDLLPLLGAVPRRGGLQDQSLVSPARFPPRPPVSPSDSCRGRPERKAGLFLVSVQFLQRPARQQRGRHASLAGLGRDYYVEYRPPRSWAIC